MMKKWVLAAIATVTVTAAQAQQKQTTAQSDRGSDKLDLKKLEDKYWSAKDTDFNVVQNRTYSKAKKMFVSLSYGPLVNDAYSYGRMTNVAAGYYFSERWGLEAAYETGDVRFSDSTDIFINRNGFAPDFNQFKKYTSLNFIIVPFYAKMSFFDRKIMYFDMQFAAGVGQMTYEVQKVTGAIGSSAANETKNSIGYNLDITQQLFFHENFAIRFDIKNKWSKQDKERYYLGAGQERSLGSTTQQDTSMLLGLTVFF